MERNIASSPKCSRDCEPIPSDIQLCQEMMEVRQIVANTASETSQEIAAHALDEPSTENSENRHSISITVPPVINAVKEETTAGKTGAEYPVPLLLISGHRSIVLPTSPAARTCALTIQSSITSQPLPTATSPVLNSHKSEIRPQSLFLLALTKLTESSSMNVTVLNNLIMKSQFQSLENAAKQSKAGDLSPPDSLTSAPPSYSYVLRQMAIRRRPRLMGTFIPSPSFIPHVPPPNYNAPFDIYVDSTMPPPPTRVRRLGFSSVPTICPECGYTGMSVTTSKITLCTHLSAIILCLLCCWACAPLPYILRSCKDVYHHCRNCRYFLGMYCPTNAETAIH